MFRFQTLFVCITQKTEMPSTYSVRLNVRLSKQNQKILLQATWKPIIQVQTFGFQALSEIWMFCLCPWNPKSKSAEIQTGLCLDFGTVWNPNVGISDIHCSLHKKGPDLFVVLTANGLPITGLDHFLKKILLQNGDSYLSWPPSLNWVIVQDMNPRLVFWYPLLV